MLMRVLAMAVLLAAAPPPPVDYSVYFWPAPGGMPDKSMAGVERQFAVAINNADLAGTPPYKLLLRASAPDGSLSRETTTTVTPRPGRSTTKRGAAFAASYPGKARDRNV